MEHRVLHLDWETRSACDLKECGLFIYAQHPSTEVLLASFAFDEEEVRTWLPSDPIPKDLRRHIEEGGEVWAHNAPFEVAIANYCAFKKYNFPKLKNEQMVCTMSMAYAMALPGGLEKAAPAVGVSEAKDMQGQRIMMQLAKPRSIDEKGEPVYWDSPEKFQRLIDYGKQDVKVERLLGHRILKLSEAEKKIWLLDQKINERGVKLDLPSIEKAIEVVGREKQRLDHEMRRVTKNAVATCTAAGQLNDWINWQGVKTEKVAKADVTELLKNKELPENVRQALMLRQEASKSSTAKLHSMKAGAASDARVRGLFQYHGASTGRWSGRRIQPQNLPRGKFSTSELDILFKFLETEEQPEAAINMFFGNPMQVLSDALRSFIVAEPGSELIWCDFASIEARVLAWLAHEQSVLDVFFGDGKLYEHTACGIYKIKLSEVTKLQRQIAKVATLALGYGGGKGAFQAMARGYGVKISDEEAESIKLAWREANKKIVRYWHDLERAAMNAIRNPGKVFMAGPREINAIRYKVAGSFLWCQLPSKRVICYPFPKIEAIETPWGEKRDAMVYMAEDSFSRKWEKQKAYGGLLSENVTQAVARDLLAESLVRLEEKGFPIVMHVHDEVVCELPKNTKTIEEMEEILTELPSWADGLPIAAEGAKGFRYQK